MDGSSVRKEKSTAHNWSTVHLRVLSIAFQHLSCLRHVQRWSVDILYSICKWLHTSSALAMHMMKSLEGKGKGRGNFLSSPRCFSVCREWRREPLPMPSDPSVTSTTYRPGGQRTAMTTPTLNTRVLFTLEPARFWGLVLIAARAVWKRGALSAELGEVAVLGGIPSMWLSGISG